MDEVEDKSPVYTGKEPIRSSGMVVSIGSMVKTVKPGDHVLFHHFDELPLPQKNMVVIRESSILGIYTD